jgi:mRNA interferase RelE/StbE
VGAAPYAMAYRVEVGEKASAQLDELDAAIGSTVERKIIWLAQNAAVMIHRRLVGMPDDLAGLCKLRVGDWRILYWIYHADKIVRIYRIQHRSEVCRDL